MRNRAKREKRGKISTATPAEAKLKISRMKPRITDGAVMVVCWSSLSLSSVFNWCINAHVRDAFVWLPLRLTKPTMLSPESCLWTTASPLYDILYIEEKIDRRVHWGHREKLGFIHLNGILTFKKCLQDMTSFAQPSKSFLNHFVFDQRYCIRGT